MGLGLRLRNCQGGSGGRVSMAKHFMLKIMGAVCSREDSEHLLRSRVRQHAFQLFIRSLPRFVTPDLARAIPWRASGPCRLLFWLTERLKPCAWPNRHACPRSRRVFRLSTWSIDVVRRSRTARYARTE